MLSHTCHPPNVDPCDACELAAERREQEAEYDAECDRERALALWAQGVICNCGVTVYGPLEAGAFESEAGYESHTIECGDCSGQWPRTPRAEVQALTLSTLRLARLREELAVELEEVGS